MFPKLFMGLTYCIATHPTFCTVLAAGNTKLKELTLIPILGTHTRTRYCGSWRSSENIVHLKARSAGVTIPSKVKLHVSRGLAVDNYMAKAMTNYCWKSGTCRFDWAKRWNNFFSLWNEFISVWFKSWAGIIPTQHLVCCTHVIIGPALQKFVQCTKITFNGWICAPTCRAIVMGREGVGSILLYSLSVRVSQ